MLMNANMSMTLHAMLMLVGSNLESTPNAGLMVVGDAMLSDKSREGTVATAKTRPSCIHICPTAQGAPMHCLGNGVDSSDEELRLQQPNELQA